MLDMVDFLTNIPKAELHLHIEGAIQAEMLLEMARRNGIDIPYNSVGEVLAAQDYGEPALANFLNYHYSCVQVIRTERDLYDIALAFLKKCRQENIRHVELFFDPQVHLEHGLSFEAIIRGLQQGCEKGAEQFGVSSYLIMCANRDRPVEDAVRMLELAVPYRDYIIGVGLDSLEQDNPPVKFKDFFRRAREEGYRLTAHCDVDQENSPEHIRQCIYVLGVERIDHGVNCVDDPALVEAVKERNICLTVCPTWRVSDPGPRRLKRLRQMFDLGLPVTINTDDPEEFASRYLTSTMIGVQQGTGYSAEEMVQFMRNAFIGSWLDQDLKQAYLAELGAYARSHDVGFGAG
jgi:adenosine deaminase